MISWRFNKHQVCLESSGGGELLHLFPDRLLVELRALRAVVVAVGLLGELPSFHYGDLFVQLERNVILENIIIRIQNRIITDQFKINIQW